LTAMVALVSGNYVWLVRASDGETIIEGQLRPLRRVYGLVQTFVSPGAK
jgi:hypothetical protein